MLLNRWFIQFSTIGICVNAFSLKSNHICNEYEAFFGFLINLFHLLFFKLNFEGLYYRVVLISFEATCYVCVSFKNLMAMVLELKSLTSLFGPSSVLSVFI